MDISVARDFSTTPGPRKRQDGQFSGQQFLEDVLRPKFTEAIKSGATLRVNLDGVAGYPTSFLEEAFGGLAREFPQNEVDQTLQIVCADEPYQDQEIRRYIREARTPR
jgi:hypothetical protein